MLYGVFGFNGWKVTACPTNVFSPSVFPVGCAIPFGNGFDSDVSASSRSLVSCHGDPVAGTVFAIPLIEVDCVKPCCGSRKLVVEPELPPDR